MRWKMFQFPADAVLRCIARDDRKPNAQFGNDFRFVTCDGMPDDARLVSVVFTGTDLTFCVESEAFDDVKQPANYMFPSLELRMSSWTTPEAYYEDFLRRWWMETSNERGQA